MDATDWFWSDGPCLIILVEDQNGANGGEVAGSILTLCPPNHSKGRKRLS